MLDHDTIVSYLGDAFGERYPGKEPVSLVARYDEAGLQLPGGRVHLFIPDCHLLSRRDAPAYPKWGFVQDDDLLLCLESLRELKKNHRRQLRVWQLGDLFDLWRARGGQDEQAELRRIAADHADILELLTYGVPGGVKARIIAGNHDYGLFRMSGWRAARFRIIENQGSAGGDVLVLHGDLFSRLERLLPDALQAAAVRFATWHSSGGHELYNDDATVASANRAIPDGDQPIGVGQAELAVAGGSPGGPDNVNVIDAHQGSPKANNKRFFREAREIAYALRDHGGYDIRLVVIGHTHWPRIVAGKHEDGVPFTLLDAGAWIGHCRLGKSDPWLENAHLAVVVGDDLRIYQLGWREHGA
jgi:UDP-2,3-diacylglucosamine pyrophosphatase LpxH